MLLYCICNVFNAITRIPFLNIARVSWFLGPLCLLSSHTQLQVKWCDLTFPVRPSYQILCHKHTQHASIICADKCLCAGKAQYKRYCINNILQRNYINIYFRQMVWNSLNYYYNLIYLLHYCFAILE